MYNKTCNILTNINNIQFSSYKDSFELIVYIIYFTILLLSQKFKYLFLC